MIFMRDPKHEVALIALASGLMILGVVFLAHISLFASPQGNAEPERFVVPLDSGSGALIEGLHSEGFIKSETGFRLALQFNGISPGDIKPGGYRLSKSMSAWGVANVLSKEPYMKWVVIPEGWRKEQIAELLADTLGWTDQEKSSWVNTYTSMKFDEVEGVYFPDTYLIPVDEGLLQVADRLRAKFNEVFAAYLIEANEQNIRWPTLLKIASLVQREAAGESEMPLIAGILWNRLLNDQKLDIDATVQYARDTRAAYKDDPCEDPDSYARDPKNDLCFNSEMLQPSVEYRGIDDWWTPIGGSDTRNIDSLYNTYLYSGLPPHPINNPGIAAIQAVLFPEETDCFYYLHDTEGNIHCSATYEEHQANIEQYLR
ncbi:MAG: endolytic transglycosylase MltG [Patescibacteria group bacterium]|nr:endolytic transglycosylase MltG [Patescibacteria group bacterium]